MKPLFCLNLQYIYVWRRTRHQCLSPSTYAVASKWPACQHWSYSSLTKSKTIITNKLSSFFFVSMESIKRITAHRQHLAFNLRMKRYRLVPQGAAVGAQPGEQGDCRTNWQILPDGPNLQNVHKVRELEFDLFFQRRQLEFHLQAGPTYRSFGGSMDQNAMGENRECKERQKRKFDTLLNWSKVGSHWRRPSDRWVVNLLLRPVSAAEKGVLASVVYVYVGSCFLYMNIVLLTVVDYVVATTPNWERGQ